LLAAIHRHSAERAAELAPLFDDRSFFESLRIEPYYRYTAQQVPESAAFFARLIEDTHARRLTLVHGDYSPKNVLVHNGRLILLDHEVIHFGDPAFDLGFSLAHLFSKAHHLPEHRARFVEAIALYWKTYWNEVHTEKWAVDLEAHAVRHTVGCTLARVAGRSKLEYLSAEERASQRGIIPASLASLPDHIADLAADFAARIGLPAK
jgi:aminoglycoside phosphotransferase (APT) family kinase protein